MSGYLLLVVWSLLFAVAGYWLGRRRTRAKIDAANLAQLEALAHDANRRRDLEDRP